MTHYQVPLPVWLLLGLVLLVAFHLIARRLLGSLHSHRAWMPFAAGVLVGACTVSMAAAATPRSVQEPAPIPHEGTGFEEGTPTPEAPGRTESPRHSVQPAIEGPTSRPRLGLRGPASWYCLSGRSACTHGFAAAGAYAAAGPRIRAALGAHWRGRVVLVDGIPVRLIDWCGCPGGRLLDLYGSVFRRLAPLGAGVITVTVVPRGTTR